MDVRIIESKIMDEFVKNSPFNHYQKTSYYAQFIQKTKRAKIQTLGFYQQETLVASAMVIVYTVFINETYAYIPSGLCVDYTNKEFLSQTHQALKDYAIQNKWFMLRIDPNVQRLERNLDGTIVEGGFNNEWVSELLDELGYKHKGYGYGYDGSWRDRFTLVLDIDRPFQEIFDSFSKSKKTFYKRQQRMNLQTLANDKDAIYYLSVFERELTKSHGFKPKEETYFDQIMSIYGKHATTFITKMSVSYNIDLIQEELDSGKYNKDAEAKESKQQQIDEFKELKQVHGDELVLAVGLFVSIGDKSWDLYSYKNPEFAKYKGTEHLHTFAIQYYKEKKIKHYDFVGFSGSTDPQDPYYGLYQFKSSFNPTFVEYIGQFDLIIDERKTKAFLKLLALWTRVRRKFHSMVYLKK